MADALTWKERLHEIIFGTDTPAGRQFDLVLLWAILISVVVVVLESVPALEEKFFQHFFVVEAVLTGLFTLEYALRVVVT
ncbi:MAG TPA: ion transporter, partial [Chitinophagales bacterium]|nr:ion transporter [Chitinophagales bacterium]